MKPNLKKLLKGVSNGAVGIDLVQFFDKDGDGKVSFKELKTASFDQWLRFAVSTGTSIIAVLFFLK